MKEIKMPANIQEGTINHIQMALNEIEAGRPNEAAHLLNDLVDQLSTGHLQVNLRPPEKTTEGFGGPDVTKLRQEIWIAENTDIEINWAPQCSLDALFSIERPVGTKLDSLLLLPHGFRTQLLPEGPYLIVGSEARSGPASYLIDVRYTPKPSNYMGDVNVD